MFGFITINGCRFFAELRPSLDGNGYDANIGNGIIVCGVSESVIEFTS